MQLNFEQDVAIDLDNLHEEWRTHASIRYEYAKEVSHLERVVKKAHEHVKVTRSRLTREAKELKLSSADLREAHYREHKDHLKAKDELIDAEYELAMAWNALRSMDDRKFALENEVDLWKRDYFSTPREKRDVEGGKFIPHKGTAAEAQRKALNKKTKTKRTRKIKDA